MKAEIQKKIKCNKTSRWKDMEKGKSNLNPKNATNTSLPGMSL